MSLQGLHILDCTVSSCRPGRPRGRSAAGGNRPLSHGSRVRVVLQCDADPSASAPSNTALLRASCTPAPLRSRQCVRGVDLSPHRRDDEADENA